MVGPLQSVKTDILEAMQASERRRFIKYLDQYYNEHIFPDNFKRFESDDKGISVSAFRVYLFAIFYKQKGDKAAEVKFYQEFDKILDTCVSNKPYQLIWRGGEHVKITSQGYDLLEWHYAPFWMGVRAIFGNAYIKATLIGVISLVTVYWAARILNIPQ